jgi:hypothetical protein
LCAHAGQNNRYIDLCIQITGFRKIKRFWICYLQGSKNLRQRIKQSSHDRWKRSIIKLLMTKKVRLTAKEQFPETSKTRLLRKKLYIGQKSSLLVVCPKQLRKVSNSLHLLTNRGIQGLF